MLPSSRDGLLDLRLFLHQRNGHGERRHLPDISGIYPVWCGHPEPGRERLSGVACALGTIILAIVIGTILLLRGLVGGERIAIMKA
jgi:hypothetical protein